MDEVRITDGKRVGRVEFDDLGPRVHIERSPCFIPRRWTLSITVGDSAVRLEYEVLDGIPTPRTLTVDPVSRSALTAIAGRLEVWTELCERALLTTEQVSVFEIPEAFGFPEGAKLVGRGGAVFSPDEEGQRLKQAARVIRDRRAITAEQLSEAAAVYYEAPYGQKHSAVMEHFGCGEGRANLLIRRAREAGLIEKIGQGKAATL